MGGTGIVRGTCEDDGGFPVGAVDRIKMDPVTANPRLTATIEPFDSFWEAPGNVEKGFDKFRQILPEQLSQASP